MRLCNQYRTAFKTVTDYASIDHLKRAGWIEVVEEVEQPVEEVPVVEELIEEAPEIIEPHALKYRGQYLSWYVQVGTVSQLRDALNHIGVPFDKSSKKKDLQAILRGYLKGLKQELKEDAARDRK